MYVYRSYGWILRNMGIHEMCASVGPPQLAMTTTSTPMTNEQFMIQIGLLYQISQTYETQYCMKKQLQLNMVNIGNSQIRSQYKQI